jgi:DNA-binding SARP family transcriptional activator/nucleotide-binding universal stress UspA family protein
MDSVAKGSLKQVPATVDEPAIEFGVLGPLEARVGEYVVPLRSPKQRAVLAMLLLHANEVVSSDRLVDELWTSDPPSTAATALQVHVSQLRKALPPGTELLTRAPGYVIQVEPEQLDLKRFERLAGDGERALADGDPSSAAKSLRAALDLWRGPALADLTYEAFAQVPIMRLEELRLAVLEARIEAELALGRHSSLVAELEALVAEHPLRERLLAELMLALYRSGRQADALDAYRAGRHALLGELGLEPTERLRDLEQAILRHDRTLDLVPTPDRSILAVPSGEAAADGLVEIAEPLARRKGRGLVVARLVPSVDDLPDANTSLLRRRAALLERGVPTRVAAFVSDAPAADTVRLVARLEADLLLVDASDTPIGGGPLAEPVAHLLSEAPCDVGLLFARPDHADGPVVVPFGGGDHDWTAIEVGAWIARSAERPLRLVGVLGRGRKRDASRLLADVSLAVQYALGLAPDSVLARAGERGILDAAEGAALLVVGFSERWRREGLGETRATIARECRAPVLLVRRGVRPSGLAPSESTTRYTWSVGSAAIR